MTVEPTPSSEVPQVLNLVSPIPIQAFNQLAAGMPFEINAILYDEERSKSRSPSYVKAKLGPITSNIANDQQFQPHQLFSTSPSHNHP